MASNGEGEAGRRAAPSFTSSPRIWRALAALLAGLALVVVLTLVLAVPLSLDDRQPDVGQVATQTILAPQRVTFKSEVLTEEARRRAAANIPQVFDPPDPSLTHEQMSRARDALAKISIIRDEPGGTPAQKVAAVQAITDVVLSESMISEALRLSQPEWHEVITETLFVLAQAMRSPIREDNVERARALLPSMIDRGLSDTQAELVAGLAGSFIQPNSLYNERLTQSNREAMMATVPIQERTIERGEAVIRQGDVVTSLDAEALKAVGLGQSRIEWGTIAGTGLLLSVLVTVLGLYLLRLHPHFWEDQRSLALMALVLCTFAVGARFFVPSHNLLRYLFPMAAASMLLTSLVGPRFALTGALLLSVFAGLMAGGSLELTIYFMAGSVIAAFAVWRVERLMAFLWAGAFVALANLAVIGAFRLQLGNPDTLGIIQLVAMAIGNGALSASLTVVGFFALGSLFDITTTLQLMELARPTHPLLRQLQMKAPGTYHHSLMISNLAEQAAQQIGADALLVRVGAYYHDVGKSVRPYFFIENQLDRINIHERLDPRTSAQIVIAHVADGLELAKKYRLPQSIRNLIAQHHGTRLASFFYSQALKSANGQPVDEADFRYPGPRPQSRESAIMMLADSVEAAVRAGRPSTNDDIDRVVRKIMNERLVEGDLDDCDLTLRDVEQIREVFVQTLQGIYHPRLQYPEDLELPLPSPPVTPQLPPAPLDGNGLDAGMPGEVLLPADEEARGQGDP